MENLNTASSFKETATPTVEPAKRTSKESKPKTEAVFDRNLNRQKEARDLGKTLERASLFNDRPEPLSQDRQPATQEPKAKSPEIAGPEELSSDEILYVRQAIAHDHLEAMRQQPEAEATDILQPAVDFLERVEQGSEPENALANTVQELGLTEEDTALAQEAAEQSENDPDAEPEEPAATGPSSTPTPPPAAGGGGAGRPPRPPTPPNGGNPGATPPPPNPGNQPGPGNQPNHNNVPLAPAAANVMPAVANTYYKTRRRSNANTLVGGLAGYLIGRRHGRRKVEKQLLPVQQQLERQVSHLEQDITAKEKLLVVSKASMVERQRQATAPKAEKSPASQPPRPIERLQPGRQETRLGMEKPQRAEHLGHVAVATEASQIIERTRYARPNNIRQAFRPEAVKLMHRTELLELSEKITIEGASLRKVYESRLITEKQLRHLVGEYLAGKDIRRELRRQMVEREIDFERDPQMRDRIRSHLSGSKGGSGGLNELLQTVGIEPNDDGQLTKQEQRLADKQAAAKQKQQRNRTLADTSMATAIVVLAVLVIVLLLKG